MLRTLIIITFLALTATVDMQAQRISKVGTSAAQFLRIPVGARSAALGGAVTASATDVSALYWNPAIIAELDKSMISVEVSDWFADLNHSFLGVVMPTGKGGSFGLSLTGLTMGDFEETTMELPEGTGRTFNAYSFALGVSYAHQMFDVFSVGGTIKYINETIWNTSATALAFDVGTIFTTPFNGLRFGASITNAGGRMQLGGDNLIINTRQIQGSTAEFQPDATLRTNGYELPLAMKVGFAYDALKTDQIRASIYVDGNNPSDNKQSVSVATEIGFMEELFQIRVGLPELGLDDRIQLFSAGLGLNTTLAGNLGVNIGYAYQSYQHLSSVHRISATFGF